MSKHDSAVMAVGLATLAIVLLAAGGLTAGAQTTAAPLESALRLDVEVVRLRRCYNDLSSTTDYVDARLVFTNVSSRPIAVTRNQRGVVYQIRLEPSRGAEQGDSPPVVVVSYDPLFGNGQPLPWNPARPEPDRLAVLLPNDALALGTTLSLQVLRPGSGSEVTSLRRRPYAMSLTGQLRVAEYESDAQPLSSARSITLDSRSVSLDLATGQPLEFCERSDTSFR